MSSETALPQAVQEHWSVTVDINGESILTIASNFLAGKPEFSEAEAQRIRECAEHLMSFIGRPMALEGRAQAPAPDTRTCYLCGRPASEHTKTEADWRTVPGCSGAYFPAPPSTGAAK